MTGDSSASLSHRIVYCGTSPLLGAPLTIESSPGAEVKARVVWSPKSPLV